MKIYCSILHRFFEDIDSLTGQVQAFCAGILTQDWTPGKWLALLIPDIQFRGTFTSLSFITISVCPNMIGRSLTSFQMWLLKWRIILRFRAMSCADLDLIGNEFFYVPTSHWSFIHIWELVFQVSHQQN